MTPRLPSLDFASRLARVGLLAFYAAVALLGSGGLHAIAPCCSSSSCPADSTATHTHKGCTHPHHGHSHKGDAPDQQQSDAPGHCPEGCLICEFTATAAIPVAITIPPLQQEPVGTVEPARALHQPSVSTAPFWIRGPPVRV